MEAALTQELSERISAHLASTVGFDVRTASANPFWVIFNPEANGYEFSIARQNMPTTAGQPNASDWESKITDAIGAFNNQLASKARQDGKKIGIATIRSGEFLETGKTEITGFRIDDLDKFACYIREICPSKPSIANVTDGASTMRYSTLPGRVIG